MRTVTVAMLVLSTAAVPPAGRAEELPHDSLASAAAGGFVQTDPLRAQDEDIPASWYRSTPGRWTGPVRTGVVIGGLGGLGIGAALAYATFDQEAFDNYSCGIGIFGCSEPLGRSERTLAGGILGLILGAGVGAIIGSLVDDRPEVEAEVTGSGGLGIRLQFRH